MGGTLVGMSTYFCIGGGVGVVVGASCEVGSVV